MDSETAIEIMPGVNIPRSEIEYRATRAGGPGGQHVNTSSTRIELLWNLDASPSINDEQRARLKLKLRKRIGADGVLRLTSAGSRSQHQNKEDATRRFANLLEQALHTPKPRKKTKVPKPVREARLKDKKNRSRIKQHRGKVNADE
ncbi:MAG TPA: alternative ribosome rescue aminoacyl-tRNA hydrolase ArfB [Longimicrobiales bacterium]|nr:alternative ribosome rescue aminoacyl-tRNA hydrolase ArfB [Longimicrobiales bacterium]